MVDRGTVAPQLLRLVVRYAERAGIDAARSLRAVRLADALERERVDGAAFAVFLSRLAELARDPLLGIRLGSWAAGEPAHHLVLGVVFGAGTGREAIERLLRFHALLADAITPSLHEEGGVLELRVSGGGASGRQAAEAAVAMLARLVRRLGGDEPGIEVLLRGAPAAPPEHYRAALGVEARLGARVDAVRLPARLLAVANPLADPELSALLERHAAGRLAGLRRAAWTGRAAKSVQDRLAKDGRPPGLREVSRALAVAPRTLQLRLAEERVSFRRVVDEVRRARGEELLADPTISLVEVAFLLGFADQSAFTNAFRRWTGGPPAAYRRSIVPVRK